MEERLFSRVDQLYDFDHETGRATYEVIGYDDIGGVAKLGTASTFTLAGRLRDFWTRQAR